jgi:hypothetical protein
MSLVALGKYILLYQIGKFLRTRKEPDHSHNHRFILQLIPDEAKVTFIFYFSAMLLSYKVP